jgi:hypothetical protein
VFRQEAVCGELLYRFVEHIYSLLANLESFVTKLGMSGTA